jgi:hypothetical protein
LYWTSGTGCPVSSRICSTAPKKKTLLRMTGPPTDPPNCWRLKGTFSAFDCLVKKSFELSFRSRS